MPINIDLNEAKRTLNDDPYRPASMMLKDAIKEIEFLHACFMGGVLPHYLKTRPGSELTPIEEICNNGCPRFGKQIVKALEGSLK